MNEHPACWWAYWSSMLVLLLFSLMALEAWSTTVEWKAPTESCGGTALDPPLTHFTIYWGRTGRGSSSADTECPPNRAFQYEHSIEVPAGLTSYELSIAEPGEWYVTMTATNADGESGYSNEVIKTVTVSEFVLGASSQDGASTETEMTLLVGITGTPVSVAWSGGSGTVQFELVEYGKTTAIVSGSADASAGTWQFTPPRAGLYEVRVREAGGEWVSSSDRGWLYYFNLAAPSGGGIN